MSRFRAITVLLVAGSLAGLAACATPAGRVEVSGDLTAHDPALVAGANGAPWYLYSTGDSAVADGTIQIRVSADGHSWHSAGTVWDTKPAWLTKAVPGLDNLWAPEIYQHDGTYFLYYAASTFGKNRSIIALATNTTLDATDPRYAWVDRGQVISSQQSDDFNAIDPAIVEDGDGTPWMAFGSFWSGIRMVKLAWPDGLRADQAAPRRIADRIVPPDAIEGATVIHHDNWYYLIVSRDFCCRGARSTYNMAVGRSQDVTGPYRDRTETPMLEDGGTPLLSSQGNQVGPGGPSYSGGYLAWHYYDANNAGAVNVAIQRLGWDGDGWPTLG